MLIELDVLTNHLIHHTLHLTDLLITHLLEVREVETQRVRRHKRTLLLHMIAEHLFQGIVEQVGSSMVGGRGIALIGIHTGHKLG